MLIKANNISKKFYNKTIFNNFSIDIDYGESIVIVGKSGSGKTTLLNILSLIEVVDSGTIYWNNINIDKLNKSKINKIIRYEVGYLFQNYGLLDNKTVYENIELSCKYKKYKSIEDKRTEILNALSKVGLKGYENRVIYSLSGGEQQRVALARLIVKPFKIIFADEPTGNLDEENSKIIMDILFDLNKAGKTLVVVTHDKEVINRFETIIDLDRLSWKIWIWIYSGYWRRS